MDFPRVLDALAAFLDERGLRYALAGALALSCYGLHRATQDVDLLAEERAQGPIVAYLESLGYETLYRSEGYSNHSHQLAALGRIDLLYVTEPTASRVFETSTIRTLGSRTIRVPRPEHLAAMKALAIRNDPSRTFRDLADVQFILGLPGIDRDEIRDYFRRNGLEARFDELCRLLERL